MAAVTTRQRSGHSSRSRSRRGSSKRPQRRWVGSRAGRKRRPGSAAPPLAQRALGAAGRALGDHADDVAGLLLVAAAVVTGLGIYAGAGGPAGRALDDGAGLALGWLRFALPPAFLAGGLALVLHRGPRTDAGQERPGESDANRVDGASVAAHVAVGSTILTLALAGLLHLAGGSPELSAPDDDLRGAGGYVGVGVGRAAAGLLGSGGAAAVFVLLAVAGLVVLTRTPIRVAADRTVAGFRPLTGVVGHRLATLFRLRPEGDDPGLLQEWDERALGDDTLVDASEEGAGAPDDGDATLSGGQGRRDGGVKVVVPEPEESPEQLEIDLGPAAKASPWRLPPLSLLSRNGSQQVDRRSIEETGRTLEKALADHGVETRLVGKVVGPTVTRYELELGPGVKVNRVTSLHKDIAYAMATPDVRILAPIPGKQAIGVEVPNTRRQIVGLADILLTEEARRATHPLEVAMGRDINGRPIMMNLAAMPHVLIAGATGAGKSSCLNSMITSILMRTTPDQVRMILVDPKRVEMGQYDRLPHLLTQVVTNPKKAANALAWAVKEMERRYDLLAEVGFRDVTGYNNAFDRGDLAGGQGPGGSGETAAAFPRLPFVLVVVDELSDLMMVAARDVEDSIARLAQMARAVGIHLVIATQRPSVNVITGLIKANVPARIAFAVASVTDSRVILDQGGAERLVGKGDMLLLDGGSSVARRIQGAWVTEDEVRKVTAVWKRQAPDVRFDESVQGSDDGPAGSSGGAGGGGDEDDEDLLRQAMDLVVRSQLGSTSMLQRKLRVGFARAGRLMDLLEQRGVVGPSEGSKARAVLMTVDELEELVDQRQ
ncbi:MAG: DNA translocase FtsK [Acidimicrobiales bacterium]